MVWAALIKLLELIILPGFAFLITLSLFYEWVDRKFYARLQNRYGPLHTGPKGLLQPLADFIKLLSKEDIVPAAVDKRLFSIIPLILFALPLTALFSIPVIEPKAYAAFEGDLIYVLFISTLIVVAKFIAAWSSTNRFSALGGERLAFQLIGYEIPLAISFIAPAILAKSLSISIIGIWIANNPIFLLLLLPGLAVSLICSLAELEKVPFDIPEAEQEIVAGWQTEFSGKKLALIRLSGDLELLLASALISVIFLGGPNGPVPFATPPIPEIFYIIWFLIKATIVVVILSNLRTIFARLRIDQMMSLAWRYLLPISIIQILIVQLYLAFNLGFQF